MFTVYKSQVFSAWLSGLKDRDAVARILIRLKHLELGNLGDWKAIGDGVAEMRIDYGPGYRLYYFKDDKTVYVLLCGGTKKTQTRDINKAKRLLKEWKEGVR